MELSWKKNQREVRSAGDSYGKLFDFFSTSLHFIFLYIFVFVNVCVSSQINMFCYIIKYIRNDYGVKFLNGLFFNSIGLKSKKNIIIEKLKFCKKFCFLRHLLPFVDRKKKLYTFFFYTHTHHRR